MNPAPTLLALRVADVEFALEPGRVYALGDSADCDFAVRGRESGIALFVRAVGDQVLVRQADEDHEIALRVGAAASLAGIEFAIVEDRGAAILPAPPARRGAAPTAPFAGTDERVPGPPSSAQEAGARDGGPAASAAPPVAPIDASSAPAAGSATFADLMARELQRAPWLLLSLLLHAFLLLLAWLLLGSPKPPAEPPPSYGFVPTPDAVPSEAPDFAVPVEIERDDPFQPIADVGPQPTAHHEPDPSPLPAPPDERTSPLARLGGERVVVRATGAGDGQPAAGDGNGLGDSIERGSGGFRRTVAELRANGLDVVFVFDSTGSMGSSITATKNGIAAMLEVLHALVPHARFSLITYRDKGAGEDYVVRSLPLVDDYYAAVNFVQTIEAGGGGDEPEAVLAGLEEAVEQKFAVGARRVIVLAGDAPPHPNEVRRSIDRARRFAEKPGSFVHTLTTGSGTGTAAECFARIAAAGRGSCLPVDDKDRLLQIVLTLAFGREFEQDLVEVQRAIARERERPPTWARDLARRGGADLFAQLCKDRIPPDLVNALLRNPSPAVLEELVDALANQNTSPAGRNAAAHVLHRVLSLPAPPIDPQKPRAVGATEASRLRRLARRK